MHRGGLNFNEDELKVSVFGKSEPKKEGKGKITVFPNSKLSGNFRHFKY